MEQDSTTSEACLEIISDVVCPWCYIGKHRLQAALEQLDPAIKLDIAWRPFELNPGLPSEGMDRMAYGEAKFGSQSRAKKIYDTIAANATADGLPIEIDKITRTPNTRAAHRLIELAERYDCQDEVVDRLFQAYFVDGQDIGDPQTLLELGALTGIDRDALETILSATSGDQSIEAHEQRAEELGVHGVPAFVFNGRLLFSGAQTPETIALSIKRAVAKGL